MGIENVVFTFGLMAAIAVFVRRIYLLLAMILLGQAENRFDRLRARLKALLVYGFGQARVIEEGFGVNHFFLFWGFILLQLFVNVEFILNGIFPAFNLGFIGRVPYLVIGFLADETSFIVLLAAAMAILRRAFFRPPYVEAKPEAFLILVLVALLMVGSFGMHVSSISAGLRQVQFLPLSLLLSTPFRHASPFFGWTAVYKAFWWLHAVVLLAFICYIPYSKHLHILTALLNCFFRRLSYPGSLPRLSFTRNETFGVSSVVQFTWKDLYDFLSCTECGRCAHVCPATDTGKVLNPMRVVLQGKENLFANGMEMLRARSFDSFERADKRAPATVPLVGTDEKTSVQPEAIWDCTTCGACVEKCPVFIEQFPKLLHMRRHLVMEKVDFPAELITLFENVEQRSNPYGIAPSDRARWADGLNVPHVSEHPEAEYLLFAGCVPSFNQRMRSVLAAIVGVLRRADVSFAILGKDEHCCGDPMRRLGNEYVFDRIVRANMEQFRRYKVRKIIACCPHCYNSLKNDYPSYGADFEVVHHTQIIDRSIGKSITSSSVFDGRVVIHDACYLGRYNGIYHEPRRIIRAATGSFPVEMDRSQGDSFCCGAGGGRLWMHESSGTRINAARTRQALAKNPSVVATSCPYCLIMFEDGLKDENAQDRVAVLDVSELLARGLDRR